MQVKESQISDANGIASKNLKNGHSINAHLSDIPNNLPEDSVLVQIGGAQDPLVRFIWKWRSQLIGTVLVATLGFLYYQYSQEAFINSSKEFSRSFEETRQALQTYEGLVKEKSDLEKKVGETAVDKEASGKKLEAKPTQEEQKKIEELDKKLKDQTNLLTAKLDVLSQSNGIYAELGKIYQLQFLLKKGNLKELASKLEQADFNFESKSDTSRLYYELAILSFSRALLDSADYKAKAQELITKLAEKGMYAKVPAVIALSNLAQTDQEKTTAKSMIEQIIKDQPHQAEAFEEVLARL